MQQTMQQMMSFMQQNVQSPRGDSDNIGLTFCTDGNRSKHSLRNMLADGPKPTQSPKSKEAPSPEEEHVEPHGSPLNAASLKHLPSEAVSPPPLPSPQKDGPSANLVCSDLSGAMEQRELNRAALAKEAAAKKRVENRQKNWERAIVLELQVSRKNQRPRRSDAASVDI
jgi:hypothetical protein